MHDLRTNFKESEGALKPPNAICKLCLVAGLRSDPLGSLSTLPDQGPDWPAKKPGDFPVGPCFRKFMGPRHTREFISLMISETVSRQARHSVHG